MSGFLNRLSAESRTRVAEARTREALSELRARAYETDLPLKLKRHVTFDLIAEYKRRSPSSGHFGRNDLIERVTAYAEAGAAAVSVLTEPSHFGGGLAHLRFAAAALAPFGIPVMRKDFLVDPYQLYETRAAGASGVLLILRLLSPDLLAELLDCARELSLFVLLEAFDEEDLTRADAEPTRSRSRGDGLQILLGVNCRDLQTLEVRPQRLVDLAPLLPAEQIRVAESGIGAPDDCARVARAGFDLALVGTALMKNDDPAPMIRQMLAAGRAST